MSSEEQTRRAEYLHLRRFPAHSLISVSAADQQETPFADIKEAPVEEYGGAVDDAGASNLGTSSGSGTSDESVEIHRPSSEIQNPLDAGQPSTSQQS